MNETAASPVQPRYFWRPPLWKWIVLVLLLAAAGLLWPRKPKPHAVKVQLLPFDRSVPAWDGSYPSVVISAANQSGHITFKTSIANIVPTVRHDAPVNQFEVALDSGMFKVRQTDIFVADVMPLVLTRTYRSWDEYNRAFGIGGNHPYDICPTGTRFPYTRQDLNLEDGRQIYFPRISKGTSYEDAVFRHGETSSEFFDARDSWNGNGWTLNFRDGRQFIFPEAYFAKSYAQGAPTEMRDGKGNRIQLRRDKVRNLQQLISPSGHTITFEHDDANRIIEAQDDAGNIRKYTYDYGGHLRIVQDASRVLYRFEYQRLINAKGYDPYLLTEVQDGNGSILLENSYRNSLVSVQRLASGEAYRYDYLRDSSYKVVATFVTLPSGQVRRFLFKDGRFAGEE
jgi:YD repeat-containing protein